ncbi:MAG: hypothetical protein PHT83_04495, partial [Bacilli bacterium]|nr:hypothetical protein [Bacilli bacterium]
MFIRSLFRLLIAALALMAIAVLTFLPIMTSSTDLNTILLEDNLSLLNLFNSIKEVFSNNSQAFLVTLFNYSLVIIYMLIPPFILFSIFISALKGIRRKRKRAKVIAKAFFLLYWVMVIYIVRMLINPLTFNIEFAPLIYFMTVFLKSQIDSTVIMLLLGSMLFFIFFELVARALNGKIAYSNSLKSIEKKKADKGVNLTPNNDLVFSGMNNSSLNPSFNQPNIDAVVNPTNTIVYNADSNKTINPQKFEEPLAKQNTVPLQNRVIYQQEAPMWSGLPSSNSSKEAQPQNGVFPNDAIKDDKPISYQNQKDLNQPNQGLGYREPFAKQPSFDQQQQSNFGQPRDTSNNYGAYNSPSNNLNNQGYNRPNQPYYGQRPDTQPNNPYLNQQRDGFNRPNQPYYGQRPD